MYAICPLHGVLERHFAAFLPRQAFHFYNAALNLSADEFESPD